MPDHDRVSITRNGSSVQIYFKKTFAKDSAFPLDAGEEAVAYVTSVGVHLVPLRNVPEIVEEPLRVDPPPRAALPPTHRPPPDADADADLDLDPDLGGDTHDGVLNGEPDHDTIHHDHE